MTHKSALILDRDWQPIEKVCWRRAFILIIQDKAHAIDWYDDIVKTPSEEYFVPAVIVLNKKSKRKKKKSTYKKRLVIERDNYVCQYCSRQLTSDSATIDHVLPRSKGGKSTYENTVAACGPCNTRKADKSLKEARMKLLRQPKKPYVHPLKGKIDSPEPEWEMHLKGTGIV